MGLGIRGWRRVGLGICKEGGVGSGSNLAPWILCSTVRTISDERTGGEFSFTGDARSTNFKLVISNYAMLYAFAHCHIHVIFTVCCM